MTKEQYTRLKNDEDYYGEFGQQFLSNSNIGTLLTNPLALRDPFPKIPAFLVGGYFHTAILEPHKLGDFKISVANNRNSKAYREEAGDEMLMLPSERDKTDLMVEAMLSNDICRDLIRGSEITYEEPSVKELFGNKWKGKADILNHEEKLIIDLKTTADIEKFRWSASKYNYDSQAYIYRELFGYDMLFMVIDKNTHQIGLFDCSDKFYETGKKKCQSASDQYDLYYKDKEFDPSQFVKSGTL
tara:strand:+ start:330 stop:1058 length:729 start_codon:yes stop_codon:yes gene_type:complete